MKAKTKITILFVIRVCLWIVALISTGYWMWYSRKLYADGVFDPYEYATLLRPVLYTGVIIAVAAVCISFVLYGKSRKLKKEMKMTALMSQEDVKEDSK